MVLTDEERSEIGWAHSASDRLFGEIEAAVIRKLAAGVSVELTKLCTDNRGTTHYGYTDDQLTTAIAAARLQGEQDAIKRLAAGVSVEPVNNDLADDISAIDCMYRGYPSYEHDAYYMREQATKRVRNGYQLFTLDQLTSAHAAARVKAINDCETAIKSSTKGWGNSAHEVGLFAALDAIRALLGKEAQS